MRKNYWSRWNRLNRKLRRLSLGEKLVFKRSCSKADVVLLDTPIHGNFGDHAIVQAMKQIFGDMGIRVTELPFWEIMLREKAFARIIPKEKTIVVPGGGFLGCLWEDEEYEFRRILKAFPEHRIIVFPQTVTFDPETEEGRRFFEESKQIYSAHSKLTLFVRDKASLEFMTQNMPKVNCRLAPDTVTVFRAEATEKERSGILFCFRNDKEKSVSKEYQTQLLDLIRKKYPGETITTTDTINDSAIYPDDRKAMLNMKLSQFAAARLVVTDRLHGMIMSAITSTPCIAFNNANGKVRSQYEWIRNNEYIRMVSDMEELPQIVETLDIDKHYSYDHKAAGDKMQPLLEYIGKTIGR